MRPALAFLLVGFTVLAVGCGERTETHSPPSQQREVAEATEDLFPLPPPKTGGNMPLEEALNRHRSWRDFRTSPLSLTEIGQLLWAAGGKKVDSVTGATRTAPSAGGIYPLDCFLVCCEVEGLPAGIYRYDPINHSLILVAEGDRRADLSRAALGQGFVAEAPVSVVVVADYEKVGRRYGERGERYAHLDAGCAVQNLALQAVALGLGTVVVGAFDDADVSSIVGSGGTPLAIVPVGRPAD